MGKKERNEEKEDGLIPTYKSLESMLTSETDNGAMEVDDVLSERIQNLSDAINELDEALKKYPDSPGLWILRARYFIRCEDCGTVNSRSNAALEAALKALEIRPDDQSYVDVGWIYQKFIKDCRSALEHYERGVGWGARHPELFYYMGVCYQDQGYRALARDHYRKYLRVEPKGKFASDARNRIAGF